MKKLIILQFIFCIFHYNAEAQTDKIDSLLKALEASKQDTSKIKTLQSLTWQLKDSNPQKALTYARQQLSLAKKLNGSPDKATAKGGSKAMANAYNTTGVIHSIQGDYPRALEYYLKSLEIRESIHDRRGIAVSYNNIGIIYKNQGDYLWAFEYYLKCLEIEKSLNDRKGMAGSYNNIGMIYRNQGDLATDDSVRQVNYSRALEYYLKSLEIKESLNYRNGMVYNNIGAIYTIRQQYDSAFAMLRKALLIDEEVGDKWTMTQTLAYIGDNYCTAGQADAGAALAGAKRSCG